MDGRHSKVKPPPSLDVTFHQCDRCAYVSANKHCVTRHIYSKCPGACVVSDVIEMVPKNASVVSGDAAVAIVGDHNTVNNTVNNTVIVIPVGSIDEQRAMRSIFETDRAAWALASAEPKDVPAVVLELSRGRRAPPELRNLCMDGERVKDMSSAGGASMSKGKFVRKTIGETVAFVDGLDPDATGRPGGIAELQSKLRTRSIDGAKRRRFSAVDVAKMVANSDHSEIRGLDKNGDELVRGFKKGVEEELLKL